ncbi:MAG: hypothetical protein KC635_04465 [Myxococcales bacterium]|nr:hypothetical protein [Myxococcales bacterium]
MARHPWAGRAWAVLAALPAVALATAPPAAAAPAELVLPVSGLAVTLPEPPPTHHYRVTASWSLAPGSGAFAGRDVIDEIVGDEIGMSLWLVPGPAAGGSCGAAVAGSGVSLAWQADVVLHEQLWIARGGELTADDGEHHVAMAFCAARPGDDDALLAYLVIPDRVPAADSRDALLAFAASPVVAAVTRAWRTRHTGPAQPARLTPAGGAAHDPARELRLARVGATLTPPADGWVWVVGEREKAHTDVLYRVAPRYPERSVEVLTTGLATCAASPFDAALTAKGGPPPTGLPPGFSPGPTLLVGGAETVTVCKVVGDRALYFGIQGPTRVDDVAPLAPLLVAVADAVAATPAPPSLPPKVGDTGGFAMLWYGVTGILSWRDVEETPEGLPAPSPRFAMGFDFGGLLGVDAGWLYRFHLGFAWDLVHGLSEAADRTSSAARYGGSAVTAQIDAGYGVDLDESSRLGLLVGWHGVSGPITENSGLAASLVYSRAPVDDSVGVFARLTPIQPLSANGRDLFSPLTAEVRLFFDHAAFMAGLELQWIDTASAAAREIPGEGFALFLRIGSGAVVR